MKIAVVYLAVMVMVVGNEFRSFVAKGYSDDLSRALGVLQRRQRWLDAGLPADYDSLRHQYGTVTHFPPKMRKKSLSDSSSIFDSVASIPPSEVWRGHVSREPFTDDEDDDYEKRMKAKRSMFRERERKIEEEEEQKRRKKKKRVMVVKKNNRRSSSDWGDTESELRTLAQRRFLDAILRGEENVQEPIHFDTSSEIFGNFRGEDVASLVDALRNNLADSLDQQRYMEGEGPTREERKRTLPLRKRQMWQDGFRYALGDNPDKRLDENWEESEEMPGPQDRWWSNADPKLLTALSEIEAAEEKDSDDDEPEEEEDDEEMSDERDLEERKREQDVWFPAYDIKKRTRHGLWSAYNGYDNDRSFRKRLVPLKRKRSSAFRERSNHDPGVAAFMGTSKRGSPIKRSPEEPIDVRKRMVKKSSETQPHVLKELKSILADDKDEKRIIRKREDGNQLEDSVEETLDAVDTSSALPMGDDQDGSEEEDFSEEDINNLYNDIKKRSVSRKRKRSWGDYFGIDKRQGRSVNSHQMQNKIKKEENNNNVSVSKPTEAAMKPTPDNLTAPLLPTPLPQDGGNNINTWMMNRYFKSMAAAMSSKKKRTVSMDEKKRDGHQQSENNDDDDSGSGQNPLETMAQKLEAIEDLMLEEALELVEGHGAGDGAEREEKREKILHRLDAAQSLVKMREALAEFEQSLNQIHEDERTAEPESMKRQLEDDNDDDEDDDEKKKKKKKNVTKKQNLVEALHVMAPQSNKRISENGEDNSIQGKDECPVFNQITLLCSKLSKSADDLQRQLVGACSRHIMCYACDYAYEEGPQIPCDLVFMREAHEICGDNLYCRSAAAQIHGILRKRVPAIEHSSAPVCLSEPCIRAYRRR